MMQLYTERPWYYEVIWMLKEQIFLTFFKLGSTYDAKVTFKVLKYPELDGLCYIYWFTYGNSLEVCMAHLSVAKSKNMIWWVWRPKMVILLIMIIPMYFEPFYSYFMRNLCQYCLRILINSCSKIEF